MPLTTERCVACRPGALTATPAEIYVFKPQIPDWEIVTVNGVDRLKRTYALDGWLPAVHFADAIAALAEAEDHHPTITIAWGKVTVTWWTHAIKGLHRNDFIMAAKSDEAYASRSNSSG